MNSGEIIQRTLDYSGPERVGHSFPESDLVWAGHHYTIMAGPTLSYLHRSWMQANNS